MMGYLLTGDESVFLLLYHPERYRLPLFSKLIHFKYNHLYILKIY